MVTSLVQLLCRTTKLCWFDDDGFRSIVQDCKQLLNQGLGLNGGQPSPPHFLLGLKILSMLVTEFHQPLPGRWGETTESNLRCAACIYMAMPSAGA